MNKHKSKFDLVYEEIMEESGEGQMFKDIPVQPKTESDKRDEERLKQHARELGYDSVEEMLKDAPEESFNNEVDESNDAVPF